MPLRKPRLTLTKILAWTDAHYNRLGRWPGHLSGRVTEAPGEVWGNINAALRRGWRGLKGGSSLARLLAKERRVRKRACLPRLTPKRILAWADAYYQRFGRWPRASSGRVTEAPEEEWLKINRALSFGWRGLKGGSSLACLLAKERRVRNWVFPPRLTPERILAWADAHLARTGRWPTGKGGRIAEAPGETWRAVDQALAVGGRGLAKGSSLSRLLVQQRCKRWRSCQRCLSLEQILTSAEIHARQTGSWPITASGILRDQPDLTWSHINQVLRVGLPGLPGRTTLARLLRRHRNLLLRTLTGLRDCSTGRVKRSGLALVRDGGNNLPTHATPRG